MYDVDYKKWSDYIEGIFKKYAFTPSMLLDLGCGTGSICINLAQRGYDMIGVDLSCEMLSCAAEKSKQKGLEILYLNQDITEFELYGTVDGALCLMDTLNYITDKRKLRKFFKLVANYLNPGGLFIFDINSEYKLENVLGNNVLYEVGKEITYIWENNYNKFKRLCEFDLTFFVENQSKYDRFEELHYERAYSIIELKTLISNTKGMELLEIYDQFSFRRPKGESERIFFVCRKSF
jgi:2-polyprenyl-3-methyl-5-hydroxy-6-metoxy-1,4-benzoquinol methylase